MKHTINEKVWEIIKAIGGTFLASHFIFKTFLKVINFQEFFYLKCKLKLSCLPAQEREISFRHFNKWLTGYFLSTSQTEWHVECVTRSLFSILKSPSSSSSLFVITIFLNTYVTSIALKCELLQLL